MEGWRRPLHAKYVGRSGEIIRGRDMGKWRLDCPGPDCDCISRILTCHACAVCHTGYPAPPSKRTAAGIMRVKGCWGRPDAEAKQLLREGKCGVCSSEISPEFAAHVFRGYEHSREVAPGVVSSADPYTGEERTKGGIVLPAGV